MKECNDLREKYGDFIAQKDSNSGGLTDFELNKYIQKRSDKEQFFATVFMCGILLFNSVNVPAEILAVMIKLKWLQAPETCMESPSVNVWTI